MTTPTEPKADASPQGASAETRQARSSVWRDVAKAPLSAKLGMAIIVIYIAVALFAPLLAPYSETDIVGKQFEEWSSNFILGTDNLGRDMLSRLLYGARNTLGIAFATTMLAFAIGGALGMLAAGKGGWFDQIVGRLVDIIMGIPQIIFALLLLSFFGTSALSLIAIITFLDSTRIFRVTRAISMNVLALDFVDAARLRGESLAWILWYEIRPNIMAPLLAELGVRFCFVFLLISSLSFLGLGIQPPTADWGSMVRDNASLITYQDITPLLPAAAIGVLAVAVNFVVDWLVQKSAGGAISL